MRRPDGLRLTLFYFDIETTGDDPQLDRIVSIQYQQLGDGFEPIGALQVLAEWEWGEKHILQTILDKGLLEPTWDFVPVGNRLRFDVTFVIERSTKWQLIEWDAATLKRYWYTKPLLDVQPILVFMNRGEFRGSSLHRFADKESGAKVPLLYRSGRTAEILAYVTRERDAALELLRSARDALAVLGDARARPPPEGKS